MADEKDIASSNKPLRVALLGAGLFATNSHAPILKKHPETFDVRAVWSRSETSATQLASKFNDTCEPLFGSDALDKLLARNDIEAIIMALPLDVQPDLCLRCLKAGKHVLSEKPIAPTVNVATTALRDYQALLRVRQVDSQRPLVWSIAENYRYEPGIQKAAELANKIGEILLVNLVVQNPVKPDNKYVNTYWRKDPSWYGGFFIDAFVHAIAGLRAIVPEEIQKVSAVTTHKAKYLPGPDTMAANVTWSSGAMGTISASYACETFHYSYKLVGRHGTVLLQRATKGGYDWVLTKDGTEEKGFLGFGGLEGEFLAFATSCASSGTNADINTPLEALRDLRVVEALLDSAKEGGAPQLLVEE